MGVREARGVDGECEKPTETEVEVDDAAEDEEGVCEPRAAATAAAVGVGGM